MRRKKEPRGRTRFLSDEERAALLDACANSEWAPLHALVLLAITTGARRGELVSLKWADVDLEAGRATIHDTKNGEQRTLPLAGKGLEALRQLILQNSARSEYLFPSPTVVLDPKTGKPQLDAPYNGIPARRCRAGEIDGQQDKALARMWPRPRRLDGAVPPMQPPKTPPTWPPCAGVESGEQCHKEPYIRPGMRTTAGHSAVTVHCWTCDCLSSVPARRVLESRRPSRRRQSWVVGSSYCVAWETISDQSGCGLGESRSDSRLTCIRRDPNLYS